MKYLPMMMLVPAIVAAAPASAADDFRSPVAAAEVIRAYYADLADHNYRAAYLCWVDDGQASGHSYADFRNGFAQTRSVRVVTGRPGQLDGALGSSYVTIPVEVYASLANGQRQHFTGTYTLRRSNDVPGATWNQLRWRIATAKLTQVN